jgi:putative DNA primase/helicase
VIIEQLISTFPFVTKADHAVALSAILTALDRRSMATAPLHAFTAPLAGTGKSLLVDLVAMLAIGRPMPVIAQGRSEEELEKRLGAAMLHGDQLVSIDNCDHVLQSAFLCQALTQQRLIIRELGLSRNIETPVNAAIYATGNNLTIAGDLNRRTLLCSLDAKCEHPEQRQFTGNLIEYVKENRGVLVTAALTVLRAWHASGQVRGLAPLGSFEEWSQRVREPLVWLGRADPCKTMLKVKDNDPARLNLSIVLVQWKEHLGTDPYKVQEVINRAVNVADFHLALANATHTRSDKVVGNMQLGRWLKKIEGRIVDGLMLNQTGNTAGYPIWSLTQVIE